VALDTRRSQGWAHHASSSFRNELPLIGVFAWCESEGRQNGAPAAKDSQIPEQNLLDRNLPGIP